MSNKINNIIDFTLCRHGLRWYRKSPKNNMAKTRLRHILLLTESAGFRFVRTMSDGRILIVCNVKSSSRKRCNGKSSNSENIRQKVLKTASERLHFAPLSKIFCRRSQILQNSVCKCNHLSIKHLSGESMICAIF